MRSFSIFEHEQFAQFIPIVILEIRFRKNLMCNGLQRLEKGNMTWVLNTKKKHDEWHGRPFFSWHHRFYNVDALRNQCLDQYFIFYYIMRLQSNICTYLYYINFINTKFCYSEFSWKFVLIGYIYRALIIIYY